MLEPTMAIRGRAGDKNAAKRPGANEGGREEEERPGIAAEHDSEGFATVKLYFAGVACGYKLRWPIAGLCRRAAVPREFPTGAIRQVNFC